MKNVCPAIFDILVFLKILFLREFFPCCVGEYLNLVKNLLTRIALDSIHEVFSWEIPFKKKLLCFKYVRIHFSENKCDMYPI